MTARTLAQCSGERELCQQYARVPGRRPPDRRYAQGPRRDRERADRLMTVLLRATASQARGRISMSCRRTGASNAANPVGEGSPRNSRPHAPRSDRGHVTRDQSSSLLPRNRHRYREPCSLEEPLLGGRDPAYVREEAVQSYRDARKLLDRCA
jgi:hypothetical protein